MKTLAMLLLTTALTFPCYGQGTIVFNNRNLSSPVPGGSTYHAPITGFGEFARTQLVLLTGSGASTVFTPLEPLQSFRAYPLNHYFDGPVVVKVPNQPPGTTGLQFVVRVWDGYPSYEEAHVRAESSLITVNQPLGGTNAVGQVFPSPDLGGPDGLESFEIAAGFIFFHSIQVEDENVVIQISTPFPNYVLYSSEVWSNDVSKSTPVLTNRAGQGTVTLPYAPGNQFYQVRVFFE